MLLHNSCTQEHTHAKVVPVRPSICVCTHGMNIYASGSGRLKRIKATWLMKERSDYDDNVVIFTPLLV